MQPLVSQMLEELEVKENIYVNHVALKRRTHAQTEELSRGKETVRLATEVKQLEEEEEVARLRAAGVGGKRKRPKRG
ncbi:hypothetical protein QFC20_007604 [Naganishia adeliensis]|uniref:Uncharacterized protein n=1 Tax=Naganishia adeliensis TaxID=92952 RepID=A0ACC2UY79_9TREE|nr:hypothetical protein QFC20_007604 [Naganishia adeliensis]